MTAKPTNQRELIEGRPALIVIDIMKSAFIESDLDDRAIPHMADYSERMRRSRLAIDKARDENLPVIFIQEVHRPDLVDFGRELDGSEQIHRLENDPNNDIAAEELDFRPSDS